MIIENPSAITVKDIREQEQRSLQRIEQAMKDGEEAAFMQEVNSFLSLPSIIRLVRSSCRSQLRNNGERWQGSMADIEDLEQEVKIKFYLNLGLLRSYHPHSARAYIRTIVRHVTVDGFRQYKRERESTVALEDIILDLENSLEYDLVLAVTPSQSIEPKLKQAMESLKRTDKDILEMKFIDGYSLDEIADKTGMSRSNVHARLTKAVKKIRRCLSP